MTCSLYQPKSTARVAPALPSHFTSTNTKRERINQAKKPVAASRKLCREYRILGALDPPPNFLLPGADSNICCGLRILPSCLVLLLAHVPLVAPPRLVALPQLDAQRSVEILAALGRELVEDHLATTNHGGAGAISHQSIDSWNGNLRAATRARRDAKQMLITPAGLNTLSTTAPMPYGKSFHWVRGRCT